MTIICELSALNQSKNEFIATDSNQAAPQKDSIEKNLYFSGR